MQKLESQYSPAPHEDLDPEAPETAVVPIEFDGQRLDAIAAQLFHAHSRARLKVWIEAGRLRLERADLDISETVGMIADMESCPNENASSKRIA